MTYTVEVVKRMPGETIKVAGLPIPLVSRFFLTMVGFHVVVGLTCVMTGIVAMVSRKRRGRHSTFGTIYYWSLSAVFVSATILAVIRWAEDYHLFILGALSFAAAFWGRMALRRRWSHWVRLHIIGMGLSYVLLLTAFYVDNGRNLPLWKEFPPIVSWLLPGAVGIPLIVRALLLHPLARRNA